jgi:hypothetical protein
LGRLLEFGSLRSLAHQGIDFCVWTDGSPDDFGIPPEGNIITSLRLDHCFFYDFGNMARLLATCPSLEKVEFRNVVVSPNADKIGVPPPAPFPSRVHSLYIQLMHPGQLLTWFRSQPDRDSPPISHLHVECSNKGDLEEITASLQKFGMSILELTIIIRPTFTNVPGASFLC